MRHMRHIYIGESLVLLADFGKVIYLLAVYASYSECWTLFCTFGMLFTTIFTSAGVIVNSSSLIDAYLFSALLLYIHAYNFLV